MNCDDQVGLVKGNDHPHANVPYVSGVPGSSFRISIKAGRVRDHLFDVGYRCKEPSGFVFGMARQAHALLRAQHRKLSPCLALAMRHLALTSLRIQHL
jgi:hypothetical protein